MRLEFHANALAELRHATEYYEARQPGLGIRFVDIVAEALERIDSDPLAWAPVDEDVRRCLTRVFPYAVLYTVERELILILAIAHLAREPGYWNPRG